MKVTFDKSGGFAGVHERLGPVDTGQEGDAGRRVEEKVEEIGFFAMPAQLPGAERIIDGFGYAVTVEDGDRKHMVEYADGTKSEDRRPLDELRRMLEDSGWAYRDVPLEAEPSA